MKRFFSLILCVMLCISAISVVAEDSSANQCGDTLTWTIENGVLILSGTGATYDYSSENEYTLNPPPWFESRDQITDVVLPEGLTRLGNFSLVGLTKLKTVKLPSTLESIGERAMMDWISLVEIEIPKSVKSIEDGAFEWNDSFSKITIYENVTEFGEGVFEACNGLTIYGTGDSKAEAYANSCNIPFVDISNVKPTLSASDKIVLTIGKTEASVWGKEATNDVAPLLKNGRTMLPARFVAEALGATVEWCDEKQIARISKGETEIFVGVNMEKAYVNEEEIILDSPAFIENNRTYTPVRFIVESLGAKVEWKESTQEVIITH